MKHNFPHLFSPMKVRDVVFPNRIFLSPQGHSPKHRHPSSYDSDYDCGMMYFDKSQGGFGGAEISYATGFIENGKYEKYSRDQIRELQSMTVQTGAKVGTGIHARVKYEDNPNLQPKAYEIYVKGGTPKGAPNQITYAPGTVIPRICYRASNGVWDGVSCFEMPRDYMEKYIESIKEAAKAAVDFQFDYVTVGGFAFGGELSSFIAEKQNHRTDEFGGSIENRCRFPLMVLQAVRDVVGPKMPIFATVSPSVCDFRSVDLSQTPDEMAEFLKRAQGLLDVCVIASGMDTTNMWNSNVFHCGTIFQQKEQELAFSMRMKKEAPEMIMVPRGGFNEPEKMEQAIANGWANAVCVGRQFVADPFWPKKALEGREEDIVPCIRCDHCYHSATDHNLLMCSVNPRLFRERRVPYHLEKAEVLKKLVVVGGGPGGCRAALTAAERGHDVTLIEMSDSLGGQLKHAKYDNHKEDLDRYMRYLRVQIAKSPVKVMYNTKATPEMVRSMDPDAVVIAIGAEPLIPRIPGIENAVEATDIYTHQEDVGKRVVMVGGGCVGSELALNLAEHGHHVTIVEMGDELATQGHFFYKIGLQHAMQDVEGNWEAKLQCTCKEILPNGVRYTDKDGAEHFVEADTVISAVGMKPRRQEAQSFYGIAPQTMMLGDCDRVGKILQANRDAYFFAANL